MSRTLDLAFGVPFTAGADASRLEARRMALQKCECVAHLLVTPSRSQRAGGSEPRAAVGLRYVD